MPSPSTHAGACVCFAFACDLRRASIGALLPGVLHRPPVRGRWPALFKGRRVQPQDAAGPRQKGTLKSSSRRPRRSLELAGEVGDDVEGLAARRSAEPCCRVPAARRCAAYPPAERLEISGAPPPRAGSRRCGGRGGATRRGSRAEVSSSRFLLVGLGARSVGEAHGGVQACRGRRERGVGAR